MIQVFVHADAKNGEPLIGDHYKFVAIPRVGELVVITDEQGETVLRVISVMNFAEPRGDTMRPVSYVTLKCEAVS
jgi:hypothetical protein